MVPPPPFPGLRSYNADEQLIFFGRDAQVYFMTDRLEEERFLCITGPSGCGKSSLARTGLISGLRAGHMEAGEDWVVLDMHPGDEPVSALVRSLMQELSGMFDDSSPNTYHSNEIALQEVLEQSLHHLHYNLSRMLSQYRVFTEKPVLLLVDQFEELFDYSLRDQDGAERFVRMLLDAIVPSDGVDLYVAITIRADSLDNCARFDGLAEAINRGQFLTPALSREELSEIIRGPVALHNGEVDPAFVGWLLNQMAGEPDRLPLLQHSMNILWSDESRRIAEGKNETEFPQLDLADFNRNFGDAYKRSEAFGDALRFALSDRLDEVFEELETRLRPVAKRVFCALVEIFKGDRDIKRRRTIAQLAEETNAPFQDVIDVVDHFRSDGKQYLHPGTHEVPELGSGTVVRVMHECLLRRWTVLRNEWLRDQEHAITELQFLARLAMAREKQDGSELSDALVAKFREWRRQQQPTQTWAARFLRSVEWEEEGKYLTPEAVFQRSMRFLQQSEQNLRRRRIQKIRTRQRRFLLVFGSGLGVTLALIIGVSYALLQQQELDAQKHANSLADQSLQVLLTAQLNLSERRSAAQPSSPSIYFANDGSIVTDRGQPSTEPIFCSELANAPIADPGGAVVNEPTSCIPSVSVQEIQDIVQSVRNQATDTEGSADTSGVEQKVQEQVEKVLIERTEAALSPGAKQIRLALDPNAVQAAAETERSGSNDVTLIDSEFVRHAIDRKIMPCGAIPNELSSLPITAWDTDRKAEICNSSQNEPIYADIPDIGLALSSFKQGQTALNRGQTAAAIDFFADVHDIAPNVSRLLRHTGFAYFEESDVSYSWNCFREAVVLACGISEESDRQKQLLWSWSNLTTVPDQEGVPLVAASAWAQKALLYDFDGQIAYAQATLALPRHGFRRYEAHLNAARGLSTGGNCGETSQDEALCDAAQAYYEDARRHLEDFLQRFDVNEVSLTQTGYLNTMAWAWATDMMLRQAPGEASTPDMIMDKLTRATGRHGGRAPSLYITLSFLECQRGNSEVAEEYREKWPSTTFGDRRMIAAHCLDN